MELERAAGIEPAGKGGKSLLHASDRPLIKNL